MRSLVCTSEHLSSHYWSSDVPHGAGSGAEGGGIPAQEEGEDDISGTQFVCETVIRSIIF